jgi:hypothetical protein
MIKLSDFGDLSSKVLMVKWLRAHGARLKDF